MIRFLLIVPLTFFFGIYGLLAQKKPDFGSPLGIELRLSGAFGDLRTNHLHSGLDFRTNETTGWPVMAAEDGVVSRIKVEPGGFGKAIYISHPNGYMTVYAHLDRFSAPVTEYVEQQQYTLEKFAVDLFPKATELRVKKGDTIAFSGNSGGSSGPHLHFEVRDDATQHILNPLLFGFPVKDTKAPLINLVALYPLDSGSFVGGKPQPMVITTQKTSGRYNLPKRQIPKVQGRIAIGLQTYDPSEGSTDYCGPYSLQLLIDGKEYYFREMNRFSFDNTRYANSLIDYETFLRQVRRIHRLYVEPGNQSETVLRQYNRGILTFSDSGLHTVRIVAKDIKGNTSELSFLLDYSPGPPAPDSARWEGWNDEKHISGLGFEATIPQGALYAPVQLSYIMSPSPENTYSALHSLPHEFIPLQKRISVSVREEGLPENLRTKALLVLVGPKGQWTPLGGSWENGVVTATTFSFGNFAVTIDTSPPVITPISLPSPWSSHPHIVQIKATDNLSGIKSFQALIDGKWALFDWDEKNDLFVHELSARHTFPGKVHSLEISVTDDKNNICTFSTWFLW